LYKYKTRAITREAAITDRANFLQALSLAPDATHLARIVRSHWAIENSLHWVLDVAMHQDQTRVRTGHPSRW
jgi:predicted transposase YbfD/YdcC